VVLVLLLALPAAGLLALYAVPREFASWVGSVTGVLTFLVSLLLLPLFNYSAGAGFQGQLDVSWIQALDLRFHLGIDGVSLPLLLLTTLLTALCLLYAARTTSRDGRGRAFTALLLTLEIGMVGTFISLDLLLFFIFFELVLLPMYGLIAHWGTDGGTGGATRQQSATKFILYTLLGSALMLLGFLLLGLKAGTFDITALADRHGSGLSHTTQLLAVLSIGLGLAVKAPMFPLHSWLPDAHTAAPTAGSVLLAGVLLKMGTYGFVRILLPAAPDGMRTFAPYLGAFAVVGILYGSLACLALVRTGAGGDLKRLIAFSSVGHMGFVLLGIATMTATGINGALYGNIGHGLITGLLFFLVGAVKDRYGTSDLDQLAGRGGAALYGRAPRLGGLLAFGAVASLGLPGLAGFWGELLAMFGSFHPAAGLSRSAFLTFMALAGLGTLLTAAYLLTVVRRICMGDPQASAPAEPAADQVTLGLDVRRYEFASWTPLVALTVLAGLWPAAILGLTDPAVKALLGAG
jgi:NADH-quinone oxidoreductase subunit M